MNKNGISILEIIIVVAIIAILSLGANRIYNLSKFNANDTQRITDITALSEAVKSYQQDTGEVPNGIPNDLSKESDIDAKLGNFYIEKIPNDPAPEDDTYRYAYYIGDLNDSGIWIFEFNAHLESEANVGKQANDDGNVADILEMGRGTQFLASGQEVGYPVLTTCSSLQWGNTQAPSGSPCEITGVSTGTSEPGDCSGVSTCNGLTPTVCVIGGYIVGGPQDGQPYAGTINGGNAGNVIVGTAGNDILLGGNNKDTICGLAGDDTIYGNNGKDYLDGGGGTDTADGGNARDTCVNIENLSNC